MMYTAKKIDTTQKRKKEVSLFTGSNNVLGAVLAFFIPFILIILVYIGAFIAPFGDNSLFIADASSLYISDLSYISRALQGKEDFFYTFQQGIGLNAFSANGNLWNPVNMIAVFFNMSDYATLYSLIMAIDMSLCGLTMYLFLSNNVKRKATNLIFSTCYSLIGFNVANCFQYNFMLTVIWLPLIAWGIMNILKGKKPWLYVVSLSLAVFTNSYLSYMLCIASVALIVTWYLKDEEKYRQRRKIIFRDYILSSLVSGLLSTAFWWPGLVAIRGGRLEQSKAADTDQLIDGLPNIFCGTLVLFLVIVYFLDRRNSKRAKYCYGSLIAFYFLTFYLKSLSMAVQGFSDTNWFNYRYSYVFSFILILIGCIEFIGIMELHKEDLKRSLLVFGLLVAAVFSKSYSFVSGGEMLVSVFVLVAILALFLLARKNKDDSKRKLFVVLLLSVCSVEMCLNYMISYNKLIEEDKWQLRDSELKIAVNYEKPLIDSIQEKDKSFYRIGNEYNLSGNCLNDPRLIGYNGLNYFGSCERLFVYQGLSKLGAPWRTNRVWYSSGVPTAFDSLLGFKYVVAWRDVAEEKDYELIDTNVVNSVYLNPYALPVSVVATSDIGNVSLGNDPFANHNAIWRALSGIDEDVFTPEENITFKLHSGISGESINYDEAIALSDDEGQTDNNVNAFGTVDSDQLDAAKNYIECEFIAQQDGDIYSYNGCFFNENYGYTKETMRYLGTYNKGDVVVDYIYVEDDIETRKDFGQICSKYLVAYANDDALADHSKALQEGAGTIEKIKDSHLTGTFSAPADSRIFFTIPYNESWTLKIDGEVTPIDKTADLFMSAPVSEGSHTFELTFFPSGMKNGMYVSGFAVVLLCVLIILNANDKKKAAIKKNEVVQVSAGKEENAETDTGLIELQENKKDG